MRKIWDNIIPISIVLLVAVMIGSIIYQNTTTNTKISASETRQVDRNRKAIACMAKTFEEFLAGNQELRDASAARDEAFLQWVLAMDDLVTLRALKGIDQSEEVRRRAMASNAEVKKFVAASEELKEARKRYKLPDFEKKCGDIPEAIKSAFYEEAQKLNAHSQDIDAVFDGLDQENWPSITETP